MGRKVSIVVIFFLFLPVVFPVGRSFIVRNISNPNQVFFIVNGTKGYVGIGTNAPAYPLDVIGTIRGTGLIITTGPVTLPDNSILDRYIQDLSWAKLRNYPTGCPTGYAVQIIGDTLTCTPVNPEGTITGSGVAGYIAKFNGTSTLTTSVIYESGGKIGIGTTSPAYELDVSGSARITGDFICTDCITLGSETQGNYVAKITSNAPIAVSGGAGEGVTNTISLNYNTTVFALDQNNYLTLSTPYYTGSVYDSRFINEGQSAGGDLSGTYPNPKVIAIQGRPVSSAAPATNQVLMWDGSQWKPADVDASPTNELQNIWYTIAVPAGTNPEPDSTQDTLTLTVASGSGLTITGDATTDTITFGTDFSVIQKRVTGTCPAGSAIAVINEDGSVSCLDVTGAGLSVSGNTINVNVNTNKGLQIVSDALEVKLGTGLAFDGSGNIYVKYGSAAGTAAEGNKQITISAGSGLTGGGTITIGAGGSVTISHADTSSQSSVDNTGGTVIQDITLDTYGHVTGISSVNLDNRYYTKSQADSRFTNVDQDETISGSWTFLNDVTFMKNLRVAGNITYVNMQTLNVNGSLIPPVDNWFSIGNSTNRWKNAYFAGTVKASVLSGDLSCSGCVGSTEIADNSITSADISDSVKYVSVQNSAGTEQFAVTDGKKSLQFAVGGGLSINFDPTNHRITYSHADTSSQSSVSNSGGKVIQSVSLDTYGHVTGLTSTDLDNRYYTKSEADSRFVNAAGDTMGGYLNFNIVKSGNSAGIRWSGLSDEYKIYVRETAGSEDTDLVIEYADNANQDNIVFLMNPYNTYPKEVLVLRYSDIIANATVRPLLNNINNLGTSSYQWANIYGVNVYQSGNKVLDTATTFTDSASSDIDVSGTYNSLNLQIKTGAVGSSEIADGSITNADININTKFVSVQDSSGSEKFPVTNGNNALKFEGSGSVSISFDSTNHKVIITGSGITDCSQCDSRFVNAAGDTMTGDLNMQDHNIKDANNVETNAIYDPEDSRIEIKDTAIIYDTATGDQYDYDVRIGGDAANALYIDTAEGAGLVNLVAGAYWDGSKYVYGGSRGASRIELHDGEFYLYVGGTSGTAGNEVSWKEVMRGESDGDAYFPYRIGVGVSPSEKLEVAGNVKAKNLYLNQGQNEGSIYNVDIIKGYNDIRFRLGTSSKFYFQDSAGNTKAWVDYNGNMYLAGNTINLNGVYIKKVGSDIYISDSP